MNPLKLYSVRLERLLYVLAENPREAERTAISNEREECGMSDADATAREAKDIRGVSSEWRDSIPYVQYGAPKDERRIDEILPPPPNP